MNRNRRKPTPTSSESFLETNLFRFGTRAIIGLAIIVLFLSLSQCTVKSPEAPQWTTSLAVPVINRTYPMTELIDKMETDEIEIIGDTAIQIKFEESIDTVFLEQTDLSVPDIGTSISQLVGTIEITPPASGPVTIDLIDIVPIIAAVPDTFISLLTDLPPITSFTTATIAFGRVWVVISNNLAVDIDTITIYLYDVGDPLNHVLIDTRSLASTIPDGSADSLEFSLIGKTISGSLRATTILHTPGGVSLRAGAKSLTIEMKFNAPLIISSATGAAVPSMTFADTTLVQLGSVGDPDLIHSASLTTGSLDLTLANTSFFYVTINITIPDLKQGGSPLTISPVVGPNTSSVLSIDLSSYTIEPSDLTAPQHMELIVEAVTDSNRVDINQAQSFSATASINSLAFASVTGVFSPNSTTITPISYGLELPDGFNSVEMPNAVIILTVTNDVAMSGFLNLQLNGSGGQQLDIDENILAGTVGGPTTTIITIDTAGSFFNPVPDSVTLTGWATFGDGVTVGSLTASDFVHAKIEIISPLDLIVTQTTIDLDVESTDIDTEDIDLITDNVEEIRFIYEIDNGLPIGLSTSIFISNLSTVSSSIFDLEIGSITSLPAPTGPGGRSTGSTLYSDTVLLSNADIQVLNSDSLYFQTQITLNSTSGQTVSLLPDDALTITGRIEVDYIFDGDF